MKILSCPAIFSPSKWLKENWQSLDLTDMKLLADGRHKNIYVLPKHTDICIGLLKKERRFIFHKHEIFKTYWGYKNTMRDCPNLAEYFVPHYGIVKTDLGWALVSKLMKDDDGNAYVESVKMPMDIHWQAICLMRFLIDNGVYLHDRLHKNILVSKKCPSKEQKYLEGYGIPFPYPVDIILKPFFKIKTKYKIAKTSVNNRLPKSK